MYEGITGTSREPPPVGMSFLRQVFGVSYEKENLGSTTVYLSNLVRENLNTHMNTDHYRGSNAPVSSFHVDDKVCK